jgi:hypothetical protein
MSAPTLEAGLEIARMAGDLARVDDRLPVPERRLLQSPLRLGIARQRRDHDQRERENPERDAAGFVAHAE